jgi:hypothetical protein
LKDQLSWQPRTGRATACLTFKQAKTDRQDKVSRTLNHDVLILEKRPAMAVSLG